MEGIGGELEAECEEWKGSNGGSKGEGGGGGGGGRGGGHHHDVFLLWLLFWICAFFALITKLRGENPKKASGWGK